MALTASATLPGPPAWDETIVPTLRKRLESESRLLAKRISAASIGSDDALQYQYSPPHDITRLNTTSPTYYAQYVRPSAIPRPSMQQSRPSDSNGHVLPSRPSYKRPRTLSQPFPFEPPPATPDPALSRSASPQSSMIKPTRIPMKSRNASISSNPHSNLSSPQPNGRKSKDTYYAIDSIQEGPTHKPSGILNEQPPFPSGSTDNDGDSVRFSVESEERPFEHWYRGDLSRNGGVGELRVARRKEMLEIASFGHSTRGGSPRGDSGRPSRTSSRTANEFGDTLPPKRRAGSNGPSRRESLYLDGEQVYDHDRVVDEQPLTDVEDAEVDPDMRMSYYFASRDDSPSPPPMAEPVVAPPRTSSRGATASPTSTSRIPTPSRQMSDPPRTPTPTGPPPPLSRGSSEPARSASPPSSPYSTSAQSRKSNKSPVPPPTPKSKVKVNTPSSSKSPKAKKSKSPPGAMKRTKEEEERNRRSVAVYPTPAGEGDMANAIPQWTQPVEGPNWDDVVLPVVARKKGLDGQYEMQDGSPKPAKVQETVYEPAPGTFGYDHSKYKPPRPDYDDVGRPIPLEEFGGRRRVEQVPEEQEAMTQSTGPRIDDRRPIHPMNASSRSRVATSPAPFAHYDASSTANTYVQPLEAHLDKMDTVEVVEEGGAGCCKCVIM